MPSIDPRPFTDAELDLFAAHPEQDIAEITLRLREAANAKPLPGLGLTTPNSAKRPLLRSDDSSDGDDDAAQDSGYESCSAGDDAKYIVRRPSDQLRTQRRAGPSKRAFTLADRTDRDRLNHLPTLFVDPHPLEMHTAPLPIPLPHFSISTRQKAIMKPIEASPPPDERDTVLPSSAKIVAIRSVDHVNEPDDTARRSRRRSADDSLRNLPRSQAMGRAHSDAIGSAAETLNAAVRGLAMAEEPRLFRDTVHTDVTDLSLRSLSQASIAA